MSVDTRGRHAARALLQAADARGPAPELGRLRRRRRRRTLTRGTLAAAALVVAGALAVQTLPGLERAAPKPAAPKPAAAWPGVPGADRRVRDAVPTGRADGADVAAGPADLWVLNRSASPARAELVRVDPTSDRVVARIPVRPDALRVAVGAGSVWVLGVSPGRAAVVQVDPAANRVLRTFPLWSDPNARRLGVTERLLVAGGAVWAITQAGVLRLDPASGQVTRVQEPASVGPLTGLAAAGGSVWVVSGMQVFKLRPEDGKVLQRNAPIGLTPMIPSGLAAGAGLLWVAGSGYLARLDPGTGWVTANLKAGAGVDTVAGDPRTVVAGGRDVLYQVDPGTNRVGARVPLPHLGAVAVGAGAVWVTDEPHGRLLRVDLGP
jgi:hypothetical protein